ncbi:DDE-type integrase/transposase/recombinase [Verrucomicrobiota bacterium]
MKTTDIPLPLAWPALVRKAMLHVASLARWDMIYMHTASEHHEHPDSKTASDIQHRDDEIALLKEEIRILQTRIQKIPPGNRPYYPPAERMAILIHKAARGWNRHQTAKAFGITVQTISNWMSELEQEGEHALVQIPVPVNKYPEFLTFVTQQLKTLAPRFGKKTIAEYFMRAGLYLSTTSVSRYLKAPFSKPPDPSLDPSTPEQTAKRIISRHPNHTWLVDLTTVPTRSGFWTSWPPFAWPQRWPFCWWLLIVIDHFSRKCLGIALFYEPPTSDQVHRILNKAIRQNKKPKYIISDKGSQFFPARSAPQDRKNHPHFKWCKRRKIKPRYGAVGKYGSIAVIERFILSLKEDCTRRILVSLDLTDIRWELALFVEWYNSFRPHLALHARTPQEVYNKSPPLRRLHLKHNSDLPELELRVSYFHGRKHLPIIELKKVA